MNEEKNQVDFKKQNGSGCFLFISGSKYHQCTIGYCAINLKEVYRKRENLLYGEDFAAIPVVVMYAEYDRVDSSVLNQAWMLEVAKVKDEFPEQWHNSKADVIVTRRRFFISMKMSNKMVVTSSAVNF